MNVDARILAAHQWAADHATKRFGVTCYGLCRQTVMGMIAGQAAWTYMMVFAPNFHQMPIWHSAIILVASWGWVGLIGYRQWREAARLEAAMLACRPALSYLARVGRIRLVWVVMGTIFFPIFRTEMAAITSIEYLLVASGIYWLACRPMMPQPKTAKAPARALPQA
jgi:hypothetical protein